jgi:hypothetical protein
MSQDHSWKSELEVLLASLVETGLSAQQKARLGELLKDNAEAQRFYKRYLEVHAMLEWESGTVQTRHVPSEDLQDLLRMESRAHAELVHDLGQLDRSASSPWQIKGALSRMIQNPAALAAIAAVLTLALILTVVLTNGQAPSNNAVPTIAQQDDSSSNPPAFVATLTATHNAQWAERAFAHGSEFKAGQRLTLTAGYAEITTRRGAVAILEAPATIELIDSTNALRLHSGKIVGICETDSSKGFLVRTPHMDITDLGTRFGVQVQVEQSELHVLSGSVLAQSPASSHSERANEIVVADESARIAAGTAQIIKGIADRAAFAFVRVFESTRIARIVEDFAQEDQENPGRFVADGGIGWAGPWTTEVRRDMQATLRTRSSNPLRENTGRYLQAQIENADANGLASIIRPFDRFGQIDRTKPHVIRFLLRVDANADTASPFAYRLSLYDAPQPRAGTAAPDTWMLTAFSSPSEINRDPSSFGQNTVAPWSWSFYDAQTDSDPERFNLSRLIDTRVPLVPGQTYAVEIRVNPQQSQWDFMVTDGTHHYDSRETLGRSIRFRSGATEAGGFLHFNVRDNNPGANSQIEIDEIEIEALPDALSINSLSDVFTSRERVPVA